ncbi:MAG: ABC transporter ATP-binding protein [Anaerolineae bacterium]
MTAGTEAILCRGLTRRFGDVLALDGLDLAVPPHSVFGFLGPNGAGKTTTIKILAGLIRATAGEAWVAGQRVSPDDLASRRQVGYLPEEPAFYGWMTGVEYLTYVGRLLGLGADSGSRAQELLALVDLSEAAKRRVGGYSRGMRQRLGIAGALVARPAVLLLDEPTSALDPLGRRDVLGLIERLAGETTVFISTHILADVERICDQVAIIARGRLLAQADQEELRRRYAVPAFEIALAVDAPDATALAETLRARPWAAEVTLAEGGAPGSTSGTTLRVTAGDVAQARRELPALLAPLGEGLVRYEQVRPTLEDVFARLVEQGEEAA